MHPSGSGYGRFPQVLALTFSGLGAANTIHKEHTMICRNLIGAVVLVALAWPAGNARAWDDTKYPNWKGQWISINPPLGGGTPVKFDPTVLRPGFETPG
jgi:hypothetical protein